MTTAAAAIDGFSYDPGALAPLLTGLDFTLMASAFGGFSDLDTRQFVQNAGVNVRVSHDVILYGVVELNRFTDRQPYLFDATGRYATLGAGLHWVF
ncbi:MAG: hypothetical protein AB1635_08405 [Acidobacteriota bacterium]